MGEHSRKHICPERDDCDDLVDVEFLGDNPHAAISLVGPGFVFAHGTDGGEEVDITHNFGVYERRNFIHADFAQLPIEANLVRPNKKADSRARFLAQSRIAE